MSLVVSLSPTSFDAVAMRGGWEGIDRAAALGYDGVEIAVRDPREIDGERLRDHCAHLGLSVVALGTGQAYLADRLSLADPSAGVRRRAIERLIEHIRLAERLAEQAIAPVAPSSKASDEAGVTVIVGLIRGRAGDDRQRALAWLGEGLAACVEVAGPASVPLAIEAINRYETDYLKTLEETIELIDRTGLPGVGVLADTFHMNIEERSITESLAAAGRSLRHVHVADSNRHAPGDGHLDFEAIIRTLKNVGYSGYLSAEILPVPDAETAARRAHDYLRGIVAKVAR